MIEPDKLYSAREAAGLIPSSHGGTITSKTLRNWARQGYITAQVRQLGKVRTLFFWGSELLRFLDAQNPPVWNGRTPKEEAKAVERARRLGRSLGLNV